jgi:hypothetical protein
LARDFLEFSAEKISNIGRQRLLAIRKARIWQAFLIEKRKFSKNKNAWAGPEDSNLRMVESKSPAVCLTSQRATILLRIDWHSGLNRALLSGLWGG